MRAGLLRSLCEIQSLTQTVDEIGQPSTAWLTTATTYGDVRYMSGLSAIKAGADVSLTKVSIRIRFRVVSPGQRILSGGVVFAIQAVLPDAKRVYVDLVAEVIA